MTEKNAKLMEEQWTQLKLKTAKIKVDATSLKYLQRKRTSIKIEVQQALWEFTYQEETP